MYDRSAGSSDVVVAVGISSYRHQQFHRTKSVIERNIYAYRYIYRKLKQYTLELPSTASSSLHTHTHIHVRPSKLCVLASSSLLYTVWICYTFRVVLFESNAQTHTWPISQIPHVYICGVFLLERSHTFRICYWVSDTHTHTHTHCVVRFLSVCLPASLSSYQYLHIHLYMCILLNNQ